MSQAIVGPSNGLLERIYNLVTVLDMLPDDLSDEELEGLFKFLPADLRNTAEAVLKPRIRGAGLCFLKNI